MTDDKEEKTLEGQEHFSEIAKSRDVEVLEGKSHFVEFGGNLVPVTKSGDQLSLRFYAFRENRLPFNVRVKDPNSEPLGRIGKLKLPKNLKKFYKKLRKIKSLKHELMKICTDFRNC